MFRLEIHTDNAAFHDEAGGMPDVYALHGEVRRILTAVTERVAAGKTVGACTDYNGNIVGSWELR